MSPRNTPPCTHELRPGTTVCLRCRHAAREASVKQLRRILGLVGLAGGGLAVLAAIALGGISVHVDKSVIDSAMVRTNRRSADDRARRVAERVATSEAAPDSNESAIVAPAEAASPPAPPAPPATHVMPPVSVPQPATSIAKSAPSVAPQSGRRLSPVIRQGTTELPDGLLAVRSGDTVTVQFDKPMMRTRRPDKFEQIVRATLPGVYGDNVSSLLRAVPEGSVARAGDLITDLPTRGVRLALAGGDTLALWPTTRVGRDGPLVVAYRAVLMR